MQLTNNGLVTWPQKGAKITLPRGPGLASSLKRNKSVILQTETRTLVNIMNELVYIPKIRFNSQKKEREVLGQ